MTALADGLGAPGRRHAPGAGRVGGRDARASRSSRCAPPAPPAAWRCRRRAPTLLAWGAAPHDARERSPPRPARSRRWWTPARATPRRSSTSSRSWCAWAGAGGQLTPRRRGGTILRPVVGADLPGYLARGRRRRPGPRGAAPRPPARGRRGRGHGAVRALQPGGRRTRRLGAPPRAERRAPAPPRRRARWRAASTRSTAPRRRGRAAAPTWSRCSSRRRAWWPGRRRPRWLAMPMTRRPARLRRL